MYGNDSKEEINIRNCVIGSKDLKVFYSSLDIDFAVKIVRVNDSKEEIILRSCVIGSMNVKAIYPSIDIDFAV